CRSTTSRLLFDRLATNSRLPLVSMPRWSRRPSTPFSGIVWISSRDAGSAAIATGAARISDTRRPLTHGASGLGPVEEAFMGSLSLLVCRASVAPQPPRGWPGSGGRLTLKCGACYGPRRLSGPRGPLRAGGPAEQHGRAAGDQVLDEGVDDQGQHRA